MDGNNVAWFLDKTGYPPGGFYSAALEIILNGELARKHAEAPQTDEKRLEALVDVYCRADDLNGKLLDLLFGGVVRNTITAVYRGALTTEEDCQALGAILPVLPYLLVMALPDIGKAIRQYALGGRYA